MKKLFFLCAFLFMVMQMQAQLYIVETESSWEYAEPLDELDYAIIIHPPDGETIVIPISQDEISQTNLGEYLPNTSNNGSGILMYDSNYRISYLFKRLNAELNSIISQGFQLIHIKNSDSSGWSGCQYYLAAP